ncbi:MAG: transposase [Smithella sp.]
MGKQFGKEIIPQVLELKKQGYTLQKIGDIFGYTKKQMKNLLYRQRTSKSGIMSFQRKRGRPRKRPMSTEEEYQLRIKILEMENDLLRSFLQAAGRI